VGHAELLVDDPRLPTELRTQAQLIATSAMSAAEVVRRLDDDLASVSVDSKVAGPSLLDVERSTSRG
jgi:hypothetical protein